MRYLDNIRLHIIDRSLANWQGLDHHYKQQ